jgi:hypothetical protein
MTWFVDVIGYTLEKKEKKSQTILVVAVGTRPMFNLPGFNP